MKKFYTLALACAVGASAFAATPAAEKKAVTTTFDGPQYLKSELSVVRKGNKAPQKVATPAEDIEGFYACEYDYPLSGEKTNATAYIEMVDDNEILLIFEPWSSSYSNITLDPIVAGYDPATGTITLRADANTSIGTYTHRADGNTYDLALQTAEIVPIPGDPNGKAEIVDVEEIKGVVNADHTINFGGENSFIGFTVVDLGGWVGAFQALKFVGPDYFKFVADEWDSVGDALFTEDWMNRWLTGDEAQYQLKPRNLPLYKNKADNTLYALENPFKVNNWLNEVADSEGYLVFSLKDNDFVCMRNLTASGLWLTIENGGVPEEFYIYNLEGLFTYDRGYSIEEAKTLFTNNSLNASKYDPATKTVTLENLCFGTTSEPTASYSYESIETGFYKITLPGEGAVNEILDDSNNGVKRFFNLQGLEIAEPAAGEIVIVKEGNKTYKTILR